MTRILLLVRMIFKAKLFEVRWADAQGNYHLTGAVSLWQATWWLLSFGGTLHKFGDKIVWR